MYNIRNTLILAFQIKDVGINSKNKPNLRTSGIETVDYHQRDMLGV